MRSPLRFGLTCTALAGLLASVLLAACQSLAPPASDLDAAIRTLASPRSSERQRIQATAAYRDLLADRLPAMLQAAKQPGRDRAGVYSPESFAELVAVRRPRASEPGLHRAGLGLPMVGRIAPSPTAPEAGYHVALTLLALPPEPPAPCCPAVLVDPERIQSIRTAHGDFAVAMDLEAPLDATRSTGPRAGAGLLNLVRPGRFAGQPRIFFLHPFDPDKTPAILIHGLMSTPRMWTPLLKRLLADPEIRARYQFGFFYYPTGQPVPLSALQLREALDALARDNRPQHPAILIGHSMGGILARAQVSRLSLAQAKTMVPRIDALPADNPVRRALAFEPRTDVSRVVFLFVPHRGSRLASSRLGALGIRLIRLPDTLLGELSALGDEIAGIPGGRLPTSIHGLSPDSAFLQALDRTRPTVPVHTILGDRGRGTGTASSDGVVPYRSAHLDFAESELTVPTGHGGFAHPQAADELKRILRLALRPDGAGRSASGQNPTDARHGRPANRPNSTDSQTVAGSRPNSKALSASPSTTSSR